MKPRACLLIRRDVKARFQAFRSGLSECSFDVRDAVFESPQPGDVLVIWNRHRHNGLAAQFERVGARVLVAENGWLNRTDGEKRIALCLSHHNGAGQWFEGPEDRWTPLGIELKPWCRGAGHILVLEQRGIGEPGIAMPRDWVPRTISQLQRVTNRKIVVRRHPGNHEPMPEPDWRDCWAAVTWASGAGIKAVIAGVPVFYGLENWIGGLAAKLGYDDLESPFMGDRLPMLRRLAHAQWSLNELASGEPFNRLLMS